MGASGLQAKSHQGKVAQALFSLPVGDGLSAALVYGYDSLFLSINWMAPEEIASSQSIW